jgi:hypothetical protein
VIRRKLPNLGWRTAIKNLDFANPLFAPKNKADSLMRKRLVTARYVAV